MQPQQPHALAKRYGNAEAPTHPKTQRPICASKTKAPNQFGDFVCLGAPVTGMKRCRMHGGATPTGFASPHFKTGEHVRHRNRLPERLIPGYEDALKDPALLDLKFDIALIDARLGELLQQVDTGESASAWAQAQTAFAEMQAAMEANDASAATTAMNALQATLNGALGTADAWAQIQDLLQDRRKMVDTERKRLVAMQQFITREQALTLIAALSGILREEVTDPHVLARIKVRFARLTDERAGAATDA